MLELLYTFISLFLFLTDNISDVVIVFQDRTPSFRHDFHDNFVAELASCATPDRGKNLLHKTQE